MELNGLMDHGSSLCIVNESVVKTQQWPITLDDIKLYGYGCGGDPVKCIGVFEAKVGVDFVRVNGVPVAFVL